MKYILTLITIMMVGTAQAKEAWDLGVKFGAGLGFSDMKNSNETHEHSNLIMIGIKPSITKGKWNYSLGVDYQKYTIINDLKNNAFTEAKHKNENVLFSLSPKYIMDNWKIGPYIGQYLDKNILTLDSSSKNVVGLEADYSINKKLDFSMGIEHSTDSSAKHRVVKLAFIYKLFGEEKKAPKKVMKKCYARTSTVLFAFDSDKVSKKEMKKLDTYLKSSSKRIYISGHTDSIGDKEYNKKLSERRAKSVADILKKKGYTVYEIESFGESNLISKKHKENRRVELIDCK